MRGRKDGKREDGKGEKGIKKAEEIKVHKIEIFFGFDFEICIISL